MALFKVVNNQAQLDAGQAASTDVYGAGIRFTQDGAARTTRFAGTSFNQGIPMSPTGQVAIVDATAGLPADAIYLNGLPISGNKVCVSLNASSVISSGLPFDSNGVLVGSLPGFSTLALDFTGSTTLDPRITFSRTSNGTLTNSNGRVAYAPHNLLTNSEDFEASAWTKVNATVTANSSVAPDGTTTADKLIANTTLDQHRCDQTPTSTAAPQTFSVYVKAAEYGFVGLRLNLVGAIFNLSTGAVSGVSAGITAQSVSVGNGWYRCSITKEVGVANDICRINISDGSAIAPNFAGNGTDGVFIWGAQLNVANAPVNLLTFSEQFDNVAWGKSLGGSGVAPVVTANAGVAPDGTLTAERVLFNCGGNTSADRSTLIQGLTGLIVGQSYVGTVWIKANTPSDVGKQLRFAGDSVLTSTIVTITADWQRVSASGTCTLAVNNNFIIETRGTFTTNQTADVLIWGAQLNTGSTALPYVATTSSIYLPPSYNSTTPKNLLGFTQEFDNAAWTKSNSFVQTNLVLWSEDVSNGYWSKLGGGTAVNSNTFNFTSTYGSGYEAGVTAAAGSTMTASVEVAGSGTIQICVVDGSGAFGTTATTITLTSTPTRYTVTRTLVDANAILRVRNISGVAVNGVTCGKMQLVFGSVPGDYQVTTSAAAAVQYSDPNGTRTADKLVEDTAASTTHRVFNGSAVTIPTTGPSANTIYVKAGERTAVRLTDNDLVGADFDLLTGAVSNIASGATATATSVGGGWWRLSLVRTCATVNGRVVLYLLSGGTVTYTGDGTSGIYVWGAQLSNSASVDSYVYNPQAAPTSTAYYGPRFDYNPTTLAANGLLVEEQRSNFLLRSEDFSNSVWQNSSPNIPTVTVDSTSAPDGATTADLLTAATGGTQSQSRQVSSTSTTGNFTGSVFLKAGSSARSRIILTDQTTAFVTIGDFQVAWSGGVASIHSTALGTASIVSVGNGWYRCIITASTASANAIIGLSVFPDPVSGTGSTYAWGAQVEAGTFSTSYIPTVASQVTRAADNASMLGDNFATWYRQDQGTLFAEADTIPYNAALPGALNVAVAYKSTTDIFGVRFDNGGTNTSGTMTSAGVNQGSIPVSSAAGLIKMAHAFSSGTRSFYTNIGNATGTYTTTPDVNAFSIGMLNNSGYLNGTIRSISYYNVRLPNATLQSITL